METQLQLDYKRIESAIAFLAENYRAQPSLEEVAAHINLSPFHFQRMFTEWAGVSPKEFVQFLSIGHARQMLREPGVTLFDAAFETGLSGTGRLHDLFVKIDGMTPGEFRNGGESLNINYSFAETPFGTVLIASTAKGICYMAFSDGDEAIALGYLKTQFPKAHYNQFLDTIQQNALFIFTQDWSRLDEIRLHLKGTAFQLKVWEALLQVPEGGLTTYGQLASKIDHGAASRAVGSAVGDNPVAFLIPCHRVIRSTGEIGQYHWGSPRKHSMIGWEASRNIKNR